MPNVPEVEELLKSGAHFGHLTRRWNPKMQDYIFMERNDIHIIDLKKTQKFFSEALREVEKLSRAGKTILFIGTKKQSQDVIKTEALRCGMPYVTYRWLGGMLTNFTTIRKSISRMEEIDTMRTDGTYDELTKKETLMLDREQDKLEKTLGGIANMNRLPDAVFVVDTIKESIAVNEAVTLHLPIIAMTDTNSDPDIPDYIIPCNDDSARTIQLVAGKIADAIIEGNAQRESQREEEMMSGGTESLQQPQPPEVEAKTKPKRRKRRRRKSQETSSGE
jgi:small subunit ribosomal protein S2